MGDGKPEKLSGDVIEPVTRALSAHVLTMADLRKVKREVIGFGIGPETAKQIPELFGDSFFYNEIPVRLDEFDCVKVKL